MSLVLKAICYHFPTKKCYLRNTNFIPPHNTLRWALHLHTISKSRYMQLVNFTFILRDTMVLPDLQKESCGSVPEHSTSTYLTFDNFLGYFNGKNPTLKKVNTWYWVMNDFFLMYSWLSNKYLLCIYTLENVKMRNSTATPMRKWTKNFHWKFFKIPCSIKTNS